MSRRRKRLRARIYYQNQVVEFDGWRWQGRDLELTMRVQWHWMDLREPGMEYSLGSPFYNRVWRTARKLGAACYVVEPDGYDRYFPPNVIY